MSADPSAARAAAAGLDAAGLQALEETLTYLGSAVAEESLGWNPYWPKWDGPWWRILLLFELGLVELVPRGALDALVHSLQRSCLQTFPFRLEDVPAGHDPVLSVPCHCQLGTVYRALSAAGVDVDAELPWIRPWFLRYQLPDGGLNCDEAVYLRAEPRSSIVSTLPALEAVLLCTPRPFTPEEERFLDAGAAYLLERRLWRSRTRGGAPMDPCFAQLCSPRYYAYDVLRGLSWLLRWAEVRGRGVERAAVGEVLDLLAGQQAADGSLAPARRMCAGAKTRRRGDDGTWVKDEAASFGLLEAVSAPGRPSAALTREWRAARERAARVVA